MVSRVTSFAFEGVEARPVDVQVQFAGGQPAFMIVGLPDKAVSEARERVRAALTAIGLGLPPKRIIVNLAPADLPKDGGHFDLPIALALLMELEAVPKDAAERYAVIGELGLDAGLAPVAGSLPAAVAANAMDLGLICPKACGPEAAWAGAMEILAPGSLIQLVNHFKGVQILSPPAPGDLADAAAVPDLKDVKGQESAKRALEVAAAGGHNLLLSGPPGSGKSMLAARLPGLLPPMTAHEMLEASMVASLAGELAEGRLSRARPFRAPHHSASMAAMVGGGARVRPGEISLAHHGVLFLDELPEFARSVVDALRQPLETGEISIARANAHVRYPAKVQLVAAMNPCPCGYGKAAARACGRGPNCETAYQARISSPVLDRIDLHVQTPAVTAADLAAPARGEASAEVAARVAAARGAQAERVASLAKSAGDDVGDGLNARLSPALCERLAAPDADGAALLSKAAEAMGLSARGYYRVLRCARTLADLDGGGGVKRRHVAEAVSYRPASPAAPAGVSGRASGASRPAYNS